MIEKITKVKEFDLEDPNETEEQKAERLSYSKTGKKDNPRKVQAFQLEKVPDVIKRTSAANK